MSVLDLGHSRSGPLSFSSMFGLQSVLGLSQKTDPRQDSSGSLGRGSDDSKAPELTSRSSSTLGFLSRSRHTFMIRLVALHQGRTAACASLCYALSTCPYPALLKHLLRIHCTQEDQQHMHCACRSTLPNLQVRAVVYPPGNVCKHNPPGQPVSIPA